MYLHKTKNGHYTPPCCYFSGELEVVECLPQTFSGRGKITEGYNTIEEISSLAMEHHHFEKVFQQKRKINYKVVRVGGVDYEEIIIFQKKK